MSGVERGEFRERVRIAFPVEWKARGSGSFKPLLVLRGSSPVWANELVGAFMVAGWWSLVVISRKTGDVLDLQDCALQMQEGCRLMSDESETKGLAGCSELVTSGPKPGSRGNLQEGKKA